MGEAEAARLEAFRTAVRTRIAVARAGLAAAAATSDGGLLARAWDELEDALSQARKHGITPPPVPNEGGHR
jgi:hypothetical protein